MVKKITLLFLFGLLFNQLNASVITCTVSGDWSIGSTWSGGVAPVAGDNVIIPNGFIVGVSSNQPATSLSISSGGTLNFTANKTLTLSGSLTVNGTASMTGSANGTVKAATFTVAIGSNATIGGISMTISGTSEIDGLITFTSATGTPTFTGAVTLGAAGEIYFTAAQTLTLSNNLVMTAGSIIDGNATGVINVAGTLTTGSGGTVTIGRLTITVTGTTAINGTLLFSSVTGTPTLKGDVTVAAAASINFSAAQTVAMSGNLNLTSGSTIGGGGAIGIINVAGNFNPLTGGTSTLGGLTLNVTGNITIPGTAVLDASAANNNISVGGNWSITGASANFLEGTSTVNFNGVSAQTVSTVLAAGETFYNLSYSNSSGVTITSNLNIDAGGTINGTAAAATMTVTGNFTPNATGTVTIAGTGSLTVTGNTTLNNVLLFSGTGLTTLTSNLTTGASGEFYFTAAAKLAFTNNLTMTSGSIIDGSATGIITVGGNLISSAGGTVTIGRGTLTVSGTSAVNGTLLFSNVNGAKILTGNVTLAATGNINFSAAAILGLTNNLVMNPGSSIDGTATGTVTVGGTFNAVTGGTETFGRGTITVSSTSQIDGTLSITNINGTKTLAGVVTMSNGSSISVTVATSLNTSFDLTLSGSATISSTASGTVSIGGNLNIPGATVLTCSGSPYINLAGNWNATTTANPDFVKGTSTVTFNGTSGTQLITTSVAGGETFYNLTMANTSVTSPGVQTSKNINVTQAYSQIGSGSLDLVGKTLSVASVNNIGAYVTCNLSAGKIISSTSGAAINFTDANDSTNVLFSGTKVGSAAQAIPLTINVGRMCLSYLELYGVGNFTKSLDYPTTSCGGGNKYHNKVTFTSPASGSHWRMGNNSAPADTFLAVSTFNANANGVAGNNNFIIGAGSSGNYYADSVYLTSTTTGGLYIGRSNDNKTNSHTFKGPVIVNVTFTGNVTFGESLSTRSDSVIFQNSLQLNSSNTSTGDIYIGSSSGYSTINITNTGQLVDGTLSGATNVYLYTVNQTGSLSQISTSSAASNSTFIIGGTSAPCVWNGPVTITSPNIDLINTTYNGTTNVFTANGSANQTCTGGNTFASGTTSTFINNGAGYWRMANTNPDAYNGDVVYKMASTGRLSPAYNSNCTYAGNITIAAGSDSIDFASGAGGRVTFNGNTSTIFTNNGSKGTSMRYITMNKTSGNFTLDNSVGVPAGGDLTLTSGLLNTSASAYIYLMDETCTASALTSASTSYVNGPMRYDVSSNGTTQVLNFPIGNSPDCRPFTLTVRHNSNTSYSYMGQLFDSPASMLVDGTGNVWGLPATVDTVSGVHYWTIDRTVTSSGATASSTNLSYSANNYPLIQLYFGTNDFVYEGANLTIVKNTSAAPTTWIDIGATCALGNFSTPQAGSITSTTSATPFNSFSTFSLGSKIAGWNSLPIELLDFTAVPNGEKVDLKWSTSTETNNAYFTIEKSKDAINFTKLIDVPGAGNSITLRDYYESDYQPYSGTSYYRIKQTDFNGNFKYYPVVAVNFSPEKNITLFPNPANGSDNLNVKITGYQNQEVLVVLRDMNGREFFSTILVTQENNQIFSVSTLTDLPAGSYLVVASSNNKIYNYKLIIK